MRFHVSENICGCREAMAIMPRAESRGALFMNRLMTLTALASIAFAVATPAFAQNRFEMEAKQRAADREEREAIRRAEHPELFEKPKPAAAAPAQEAAAPTQAATEPVAAAPAAPAPAQ